ncbi:MAG TPA: hypothetical protein VN823_17070 [Stellaceae bacterium]|nr:hypothetical protein [Stellaceae bacterium]
MSLRTETAGEPRGKADALYAALEERILDRDQVGASRIYYDLLRARRPLTEMLAEIIRIHAPYTHVPYHERIDDGFVNFVNNDHCLLSARATLHLAAMLDGPLAGLPMAQTIWYVPTALDIWNQKIAKAPGHYTRGFTMPAGPPPAPVAYWPDQEPVKEPGTLRERLGHWMTLVHRGQVLEAYRIFLGLVEEPAHRQEVLAELVFAGLIDLQDRSLNNRSYTTGHKAFRARATVELGTAIGWDAAHDVVYAGALDMAVGPRWYSTYEMACNTITVYIEGAHISAIPYSGTTPRERALLANSGGLTKMESAELVGMLLHEHEPAYVERISALLLAGKSPRRILDAIQVGAAEVILATEADTNFSLPQHCSEYCSTLGWFYDHFEHPQRLKLLFVAAAYVNQAAWHQARTGDLRSAAIHPPAGVDRMTGEQILDRMEAAIVSLDGPQSVAWTQAYLDSGTDRSRLTRRLALVAASMGNDPHNQEIAQCLLRDYATSTAANRDRLLLACAQHTARHRKYGDFMEATRRFKASISPS